MKSLKDYSINITEQEYHEDPAWSHSLISTYATGGFASLATLHEKKKPTPYMEFGTLFDCIMTKGKATLDEYAVVDLTIPDAEKKALDYIATRTDKPNAKLEELSPDTLSKYCDECQYQTRWGYDARLKHLTPYSSYYDSKRSGKIPVSSADWNDAMEMYRVFRSDPYLKTLFGTKSTNEVEYLYQTKYKALFDIDGKIIEVRIMPDLLVVNHKEKTIQPVDLKTSSVPAYSFGDNFIKYRYDIQAELYTDTLRKICDESEYRDYTILPFLFTDISRSDKVPVTFVYDPSKGFSYTRGDKTYRYKGWKELLSEILYYEESNAIVPNYITTEGPNDLIEVLSK